MAQRFCPRCNAEVEDTGGYCLLGHDLRLEAPVDSLTALRAEVNRTFEEARRELADVMAPAAVLAPEIGLGVDRAEDEGLSAARHPAGKAIRLDEALVVEGHEDDREWSDPPAAEARDDATPAAASQPPAHHTVWEGLEEGPTLSPNDPIATFAPSPRMDWGPRRARFGRRGAPTDEQHAGA
jgi:hypothetical protein